MCLPSSRSESFGDHCTKTTTNTGLSLWCKMYHASVFLCCKFDRDWWLQRSTIRQKLLEASSRVGAILTTVASCSCPQCCWGLVNERRKMRILPCYISFFIFSGSLNSLVPPWNVKNSSFSNGKLISYKNCSVLAAILNYELWPIQGIGRQKCINQLWD